MSKSVPSDEKVKLKWAHGDCVTAREFIEPGRTEYPANRHCDLDFKVWILGDATIGKGSFCKLIACGKFDDKPEQYSAIGYRCWQQNVIYKDSNAKHESDFPSKYAIAIRLFTSPANQATASAMSTSNSLFRGTHGVILAFDITNRSSFESIASNWFVQCEQRINPSPQYLLVGMKGDCRQSGSGLVRYEEAVHLANILNAPYIECSSKTDFQVNDVVATLLHRIIEANRTNLDSWISANREASAKWKPKPHQELACTIS